MPNEATPAAGPGTPELGIVDGLVQLSFLVQGILGRIAAEHGLSVVQLRMFGVLRDRTPLMQELARHLGLDKSSMTGLVARAEARGLVRRTAAPHDGRAVQVSLTEQGRELAAGCTAEAGARIRELTANLSDGESAQLALLAGLVVRGSTELR